MTAKEEVKIELTAVDNATAVIVKAAEEAEKASKEAEKARQQQLKAEQDAINKLESTKKQLLEQLEAERLLVEEGAEAAERYKLTLQGVDDATIQLIQTERRRLDVLRDQQKQDARPAAVSPQAKSTQFRDTKATTEFFGAIAGMAGGGQIASMAGQMAGLTEKTSQFNEVAKQGGAAAFAFKAGIVAATAAIAFQLGKAIGDVIFQTAKWTRELERADKAAAKLEARRLSQLAQQMADFRASLEFEGNPDAAVEDRIAMLNVELAGLQTSAQAGEKALDALLNRTDLGTPEAGGVVGFADDIASWLESKVDNTKRLVAEQEKENAQTEATIELRKKEKEELERLIGIEKEREQLRQQQAQQQSEDDYITSLRDQAESANAALADMVATAAGVSIGMSEMEASTTFATDALEAQRNAGSQSGVAQTLLADIAAIQDAQNAVAEGMREREAERQKEEDRIRATETLKENELERMREEIILLEQGKEAAHAYRLEKQGLSKEDAASIAGAQARLDLLKAKPGEVGSAATSVATLQAQESRLLTRGTASDPQEQIAKNTEEQLKVQQQQQIATQELKTLMQRLVDKPTLQLEVAS